MKRHVCSAILIALLLVCLSAAALANGSIRPWLLDIGDDKWGPVPEDRLNAEVFATNGNIVSKYYKKTGVLYHSYHGNADKHVISDETFTNVIIDPPEGAVFWQEFFYEGISLNESQQMIRRFNKEQTLADISTDVEVLDARYQRQLSYNPDDDLGFPYYEMRLDLFKREGDQCVPKHRASQGMGNLYLAAWFDAQKKLIRVDWLVETSDDFRVPYQNISESIFPTCISEDKLPDVIEQPVLINPPSPNHMKFSLMMYYYPSYRGNTDFAELLLVDSIGNIIPNFDQPVVIYWPYPEGYSYSSPVHYKLKHYLDNTHTDFEMLDVTPTQKGLRMMTDSFSPFELTWSEINVTADLPQTGDQSSLALWAVIVLISVFGAGMMRKRAKA